MSTLLGYFIQISTHLFKGAWGFSKASFTAVKANSQYGFPLGPLRPSHFRFRAKIRECEVANAKVRRRWSESRRCDGEARRCEDKSVKLQGEWVILLSLLRLRNFVLSLSPQNVYEALYCLKIILAIKNVVYKKNKILRKYSNN